MSVGFENMKKHAGIEKLDLKRPQPDLEFYKKVLDRGFINFPERRENYQNYLNTKVFENHIDFMPIKLDIEIAARCNLRCPMCDVSTWKGGWRKIEDMSIEDFKEIINIQYGAIELRIQGLGEPTLNKSFPEMIAYARSKDLWVRTTTNATLLHKEELYKRIIDADICEIMISIDGVSKETYEKIRIKSSFEKMVENCKLLNRYLHQKKNFSRSKMWVTIQNDNIHELFDFPKFAVELGFDKLGISIELTHWGKEEWSAKNLPKIARVTQEDIDKLTNIASKLGIEIGFESINKYSMKHLCSWPFERAYISTDKRLVPCCMVANSDVYNFGVLGDFQTLWNNEQYKDFRSAHINGKVPKICLNCYE